MYATLALEVVVTAFLRRAVRRLIRDAEAVEVGITLIIWTIFVVAFAGRWAGAW